MLITKANRTLAKKLYRYEKVVKMSQLREGMVLIDKWGCKRNILSITETEIWLSHKYGHQSRATGKIWPRDQFLTKFSNWIFQK